MAQRARCQVSNTQNGSARQTTLSPAKRALLEKLRRGDCGATSKPETIGRRQAQDRIPLSYGQQRLWLVQQCNPGSTAYNISGAVRLCGRLNVEALERSLNEIAARHEILRTTLAVAGDQPFQVIAAARPLAFRKTDLRGLCPDSREKEARNLALEEANRPFDLIKGPLFRAGLIQLDDQEHILLLSFHHVIFDGWSQNILLRELGECYQAFSRGDAPNLPPLPIQYADYAIWQRSQDGAQEAQLNYWKQQLAGAPTSLDLPTDYPRPPKQTFRGARRSLVLSDGLAESLKTLSQREGVTMFMLLLAAFKALLYRYKGQCDLVVGSPVAGRSRTELENLIGFFVNMLVLRTKLAGDLSFRELLQRVRETTLDAYANQDIPFDRLVQELNPARDASRTPLFQIVFMLQKASTDSLKLAGLDWIPLELYSSRARFDLTLFMIEREPGLTATFIYNIELFKPETIDRMLQHLERLLDGIAANPDTRLDDLDILSVDEKLLLGKTISVDVLDGGFAF
ncbi:MAG TPA: condensation domain-containing protein [Blastocatellia bacterium]|nr:condensation domain-containing protein [Blastocatellia bacterium]